MNRELLFLVCGAGIALAAFGQAGQPDMVFATIPFDQWLAEREQAHFRWTVRVAPAELANSQRLHTRVEVQVDGNELVRRRGQGELVMFVQFSDDDHHVFQSHGVIDLQEVTEAAAKSNSIYTQEALVTPGDYRIDLGLLDTKTGEHATARRMLHVNPLKNDPLPESWRTLPPVELLRAADPPDDWFLPYLTGRLQLPLETKRPVRIDLLVNASPTAVGPGMRGGQVNNRSLVNLIPAFKVMSQVQVSNGVLNVALLDLTKRRVLFTQDAVHPLQMPLDWPRLRPELHQADPNKIDVRALVNREQNAQFFVEQVRRRILPEPGAPAQADPAIEPARVVIVLSGPMAFASGEDLHPMELTGKPNARLFYVRYHSFKEELKVELPPVNTFEGRRGARMGVPRTTTRAVVQEPLDGLEPMLKLLQPRVFDVYTPEQFRKALGDLMKEITKL